MADFVAKGQIMFEAPEEALAEYLRWQESIPNDLAKPFRAITTAWRT